MNDAYHDFLQWATEKDVELHGVEPRKIPGRGIGMIATERIEVYLTVIDLSTNPLLMYGRKTNSCFKCRQTFCGP